MDARHIGWRGDAVLRTAIAGHDGLLSTVSTICGNHALYARDFFTVGALMPDIARH
jgi:hypothetical protein